MKHNALIRALNTIGPPTVRSPCCSARDCLRRLHTATNSSPKTLTQAGQRQHRDNIWIPSANLSKQDGEPDATQLLTRAGYLRQAYSGIYHMLPLGLRVQEKLEGLIDKHMKSIGASKVSLSSISSQNLWQQSGRLAGGSEFFKFRDRRDADWLLAPTHEEEITSLVRDVVFAPQQLPVRLYQISRKYRDEKRPRGGLLRGREFIMKDLYTFDRTQEAAHATYEHVRQAYRNFLGELKVRYLEARADSGNMGGSLSHEYHFPSPAGEDNVITCSKCGYARNEEWVDQVSCSHDKITSQSSSPKGVDVDFKEELIELQIIDRTGRQLVKSFAPSSPTGSPDHAAARRTMNPYAIKAVFDGIVDLDTGVENPMSSFQRTLQSRKTADRAEPVAVHYLFDGQISNDQAHSILRDDYDWLSQNEIDAYCVQSSSPAEERVNLLKQQDGDICPQCHEGELKVNRAIEIGHTFHLGTRYSSKLDFALKPPQGSPTDANPNFVEMGCHGIGVSRLIAAVTSSLADKKGLNWPRAIAPFEAVILTKPEDANQQAALALYDELADETDGTVDTLIDDRKDFNLGWKMKDADLIGYPVMVVVGKSFEQEGKVEVQCRRLDVKTDVDVEEAAAFVRALLEQL